MPQPYNLTNATSGDTMLSLFTASNQMTDYLFGAMILLMVWIIIFIRLKMYSTESAMVAASFITALLAVFLFIMGLITQQVLMVVIILFAIMLILRFMSN